MLVIRSLQMHAIGNEIELRTALKHLQESFPEKCSGMTGESLADFARRALLSGRRYGLNQGDLLTFVDVAFLFGEDFDVKLDWARQILSDESPGHLPFRGSLLVDQAVIELKRLERI
jgi:hypothetical protein